MKSGFNITRQIYRIHCSNTQIPLDIIPFGKISNNKEDISWPPEHAVTMSVSGFEEAWQSAITVNLSGNHIKLASLPGLTLLKLIAWDERRHESKKDSTDFFTILTEYQHIDPQRLYEDYVPAAALNHEPERLGAWLLGKDTQLICQDNTLSIMNAIKTRQEQLIDDIYSTHTSQGIDSLELLIDDFWHGFEQ